MKNDSLSNPVFRSLNKPLTILGAERKLFFLAMVIGAAAFNLFGSLSCAVGIFSLLYFLARWSTQTDPQMLRIVLNASRFKVRYDPAKWEISTKDTKG